MTECPDCVLCCAVLVWCPVLFPNIFNLVLKFSALPGIRLPLERLLEFLPTTSTSKSLWVLGEIMAASVFASHSPPFLPPFSPSGFFREPGEAPQCQGRDAMASPWVHGASTRWKEQPKRKYYSSPEESVRGLPQSPEDLSGKH